MPSTYSSLKIQLMATGENNTTWGDVTNTNLGTAIEEAIAGSAIVTFADADVTLTLTDSNASQPARNMRLSLTGSVTANRNLIVPSIEKAYIINNGLTFTIGVKNATGSTVSVPAGKTMWVYNNGSNVVDVTTHLTSLSVGAGLDVTGASTVTANSSSDALRITQTGAGNAILVEDAANPDASPFAIDASGNALLGDLTAYTMGNAPKMQVSGTSGGASSVNAITWSTSGFPQYSFGRSRGATAGTFTAVASGDELGAISFYGANANATSVFNRGGYIVGVTDGTPGTTNVPVRIAFFTGTNAASPVERLRIDSNGNVLVTGSGGLGYGTGSGGAVTQLTSRTTGVTLNKTNGAITLVSAAGTATWQSFTVTNSTVAATDTVIVSQKSGTDLYQIFVTAVAAGSFRISFATTGGTTTEQPVFNFAVIEAVTA
jgi:hypothetical protein